MLGDRGLFLQPCGDGMSAADGNDIGVKSIANGGEEFVLREAQRLCVFEEVEGPGFEK